ncbi:radical SAM/SPASM domain-containing protein [Candidatus Omnitrophota bacterium]
MQSNSLYKKPSFCDLVITENCMLRCKMCRMWQSKRDSDDISIETWKRFIDHLAGFVDDSVQMQFVGGEPLLKKGVLNLIRHATRKGFLTTMTTNACLIDEDMARGLKDAGLSTLVLSLDSLKKETHDFLRGAEGTYDRVMQAISFLSKFKDYSMKLHIVTTIMQPNLDDIVELAEWANENKAIDHISFQAVMQPFFTPQEDMWYRKEEFSSLWPKDMDRIDYALCRLGEFKNKGYKITNPAPQFNIFKSYFKEPERFVKNSRCNLGYNSLTVNTAGEIFLCNSMKPIGNIRDKKGIKDLWFSEKAEQVRNDIKNCKHNCKLMINCFFEEEFR